MRRLEVRKERVLLVTVMAVLVLGLWFTPVKAEEEERPTTSVYVDFLNQYIWRGYALSDTDGMVIQPSATVSYKGFSLNIWGNLDTNDHNPVYPAQGEPFPDTVNWNETDVTLSYSHTIYKDLSGSVGVIYYGLDNADDSVEVYASLSYAFPWFTAAITGYREVSHYPGWWLQFDLSRNFKIPCYDMSIDLGATFYYQASEDSGAYPNPDDGGTYSAWQAGQIAAGLNIPIGKYVTVTPKVGYAFPLSSIAEDQIENLSWDNKSNHVFGGLRITAAF